MKTVHDYERADTLAVNDLWQSAYMLSIDVPLLSITTDGSMVVLLFDNAKGRATEESRRWENSNPLAPARSILRSFRWLSFKVREARKQGARA